MLNYPLCSQNLPNNHLNCPTFTHKPNSSNSEIEKLTAIGGNPLFA